MYYSNTTYLIKVEIFKSRSRDAFFKVDHQNIQRKKLDVRQDCITLIMGTDALLKMFTLFHKKS